ncbi:hypothetical protein FP744_10001374 [Trichoderma asperellum]|nr:hypothetical protein LI328DRAFT_126437 [Trichoderma asperelloides]
MDQTTGIIEREFPNAVTYDVSQPDQVTVTLPPKSTWSSGLHWHETHTEYLKVIKGSIKVRLGDTEQIITATQENQPELKVERYAWHEWQRAELEGDEVVVVERTDPADGEKAIFFWNLNGVILNAARVLNTNVPGFSFFPASIKDLIIDFWIRLNLFIIFHSLDNIPVILSTTKYWNGKASRAKNGLSADWFVSHLLLSLASLIGRVFGLQAVRAEYTPLPSYQRWQEHHNFDKSK